MTISDLYRKIKTIFNDTNEALLSKGLNTVDNLCEIPDTLATLEINRLPYLLANDVMEITEDDISGVEKIRQNAFYGRDGLTSVTVPNTVVSIGELAFRMCTSLTHIYLKPTTPPSLANRNAIPTTATIHVPIGSGAAYKAATNWSNFARQIIEDIEV